MDNQELFLLTNRPQAKYDEDGDVEEDTATSIEQSEAEHLVCKALDEHFRQWLQTGRSLQLHHTYHIDFLIQKLGYLPSSYEDLDSSQTWLAFWIVHGLYLFNIGLRDQQENALILWLASCQSKNGGFGGGPRLIGHLATSYGAINCLCALQSREVALSIIDRKSLLAFLRFLRQRNGSFMLHAGGEVDIRGAYCAVAVATLTNIASPESDLFTGTAEWIAKCQKHSLCIEKDFYSLSLYFLSICTQNYDGGFGSNPETESQGGYTFCAIAALSLLQRTDCIDLEALLRWAAFRQMAVEGGFQGRCNKVVGSCYAFWIGAIFPLLETALGTAVSSSDQKREVISPLFHSRALQEFLLAACQKHPSKHGQSGGSSASCPGMAAGYNVGSGGFIDKPGGNPDPYHTCFGIAGLAVAQATEVAGSSSNQLRAIDCRYNLGVDAVRQAKEYFVNCT